MKKRFSLVKTRRKLSSLKTSTRSNSNSAVEVVDFDMFICCDDRVGREACTALRVLLQKQGVKVWISKLEVTCNDGDREGIERSRVFVLFLTDGALQAEKVRQETEMALKLGKQIVLMHETEAAHGGLIVEGSTMADMRQYKSQAPKSLAKVLEMAEDEDGNLSSIPFERKDPQRTTMLKVLEEKAKLVKYENDTEGDMQVVSFSKQYDAWEIAKQKAEEYEEGTRLWIFEYVDSWYKEQPWSRVFVLMGYAGVGKSVFCAALSQREQVVAVHFFKHDDERASSARTALLSIADQLVSNLPGFREAIFGSSHPNESDLRTMSLTTLFERIIAIPANNMANPPLDRKFIVMDALDECQREDREELLQIIQSNWIDFAPDWLGIFVSTRPEDYIPFKLLKFHPKELNTEENANEQDIRKYLEHKLKHLMPKDEYQQGVDLLVERSQGLFLYVRFLNDKLETIFSHNETSNNGMSAQDGGAPTTPKSNTKKTKLRLADLEQFPVGLSEVYGEYFGRFKASLGDRKRYKLLLSPMLAAREPLPVNIWKDICGYEHKGEDLEEVEAAEKEFEEQVMTKARQLLYVSNGQVRFVHKSMSDWLSGSDRDNPRHAIGSGFAELRVSENQGHKRLGDWCFRHVETSDFALQHVVYHGCRAKRYAEVRDLITDFNWLLRRVAQSPHEHMWDVQNYYLTKERSDDYEVGIINAIIRLGSDALVRDPRELASQILGRTDPDDEGIKRFREQAMSFEPGVPWWQPVKPMLIKGDSPQVRVFRGQKDAIDCCVVSPDRTMLASGDREGTLVIWSMKTGEKLRELDLREQLGQIKNLSFSGITTSNQVLLAVAGSNPNLHIYNAHTGALVYEFEVRLVTALKLAPDGRFVWYGVSSRNALAVTKLLGNGSVKHVNELNYDMVVRSIDTSKDGSRILVGARSMYIYEIADIVGFRYLIDDDTSTNLQKDRVQQSKQDGDSYVFENEEILSSVVYEGSNENSTPPLEQNAENQDDSILYDPMDPNPNPKPLFMLEDNNLGMVSSCRFSGDASRVVASYSLGFRSVRDDVALWSCNTRAGDDNTGIMIQQYEGVSNLFDVALSDNGKYIVGVTGGERSILVWSANGPLLTRIVGAHQDPIMAVDFCGSNTEFVTGGLDKTCRLWDLGIALNKPQLERPPREAHSRWIVSMAFTLNGEYVITGGLDSLIVVWSAKTGEVVHRLEGHTDTIWHLVTSPDSKKILSGSPDMTLRIWDIETGHCDMEKNDHQNSVSGVSWAPDFNYFASGSFDTSAIIYSYPSGDLVHRMQFSDPIGPVQFSHNMKMVIVGTTNGPVHVMSLETGQRLYELKEISEMAPRDFTRGLTISNDCKVIVLGNDDHRGYVWRLNEETQNMELEHTLGANEEHKTQIRLLSLTLDGRIALTSDRVNKICVWDTETGKQLEGVDPHNYVFPFPFHETDGLQGLPMYGTGIQTHVPHHFNSGIGYSTEIGTINTRKLISMDGKCCVIAEGDFLHILKLRSPT